MMQIAFRIVIDKIPAVMKVNLECDSSLYLSFKPVHVLMVLVSMDATAAKMLFVIVMFVKNR